MTYERKLSSIDRSFLAHPEQDGRPVRQRINQFIIEGPGELDLTRWKDAVAKAAKANPSSCLKIKGHLGRSRWVEGPLPAVTLLEDHQWNGCTSDHFPFLNRTFDLRQGPTADILLLPGSPARILVSTHHAVMDGMSTRFFMEGVFCALRGEPVPQNKSCVRDIDIVRSVEVPTRAIQPTIQDALPFNGAAEPAEKGVTWRRAFIPGNFKNVSPMILFELAKIVRANNEADGKVRFLMPINLRRHIDDKEAMGNLSYPVTVDIDISDTETDVRKKILTTMKNKQDLYFPPPFLMNLFTWTPSFLFMPWLELTSYFLMMCLLVHIDFDEEYFLNDR